MLRLGLGRWLKVLEAKLSAKRKEASRTSLTVIHNGFIRRTL